jgi:hypothetical protein
MSSLWTPGGERPVGRPQPEPPAPPADAGRPAGAEQPSEAELEELRQQLARTPAEVVVANHVFGLFELAFLHLSVAPPQMAQARLAIDAAAAMIEGLRGRLGEAEATAREGLTQLRLAFVQISDATSARPGDATSAGPDDTATSARPGDARSAGPASE